MRCLMALLMMVSLAAAQRSAPHFSGRASHSASRSSFYSAPFLSDFPYGYGLYDSAPPAPPPAAYPVPAATEPAPLPAEPLLLELRGDRYVRVSGAGNTEAEILSLPVSPAPPTPAPPANAILIFRDGHREEVSQYTITAGSLYAAANYYGSGSWNRKIELSSLDLPRTVAENKSRGVAFQLPSAPNVVIVGP